MDDTTPPPAPTTPSTEPPKEKEPAAAKPAKSRRLSPDHPTAKHGNRVTPQVNEAMYAVWKKGERQHTRLAKMFGMGIASVATAIKRGYPAKGMFSFIERERREKEAADQATQQAAVHKTAEHLDAWDKAKRDNLQLAAASKAVLAQMIRKIHEASQRATFGKLRRVKQADGTWAEVEGPPSAIEVASAMRMMASAMKELGQHESFWMGGPSDRTEVTAGKGWMALTQEQLDYVITSGGQLPPGVSEESLWQNPAPEPVKN